MDFRPLAAVLSPPPHRRPVLAALQTTPWFMGQSQSPTLQDYPVPPLVNPHSLYFVLAVLMFLTEYLRF